MIRARVSNQVVLTLAAALVTLAIQLPRAGVAAEAPDSSQVYGVAAYGISLAMNGKLEEAEAAFLSQLSMAPGDAGAINNIGNVYFLRHETGAALVFYERAMDADTLDAGIVLNRSLGLMLEGRDSASLAEAAHAIRLAGGVAQAGTLVALRGEPGERMPFGVKGADSGSLSPESIRALLQAASKQVPALRASGASDSTTAKSRAVGTRQPAAWRSAGPRGAGAADLASSLYWRR